MEEQQLKELFKKYHEGTCTEEERAVLEDWYLRFNEEELDIRPIRIKAIGKRIFRQLPGNEADFITMGLKLAAAAVTIGILFMVALNIIMPDKTTMKSKTAHTIDPGYNQAILTLANGKRIELNKASTGQIASQQGSTIIKKGDGEIAYSQESPNKQAVDEKNKVTIPFGGQWQLVLSDGSKVWLNSGSTLEFPTNFKNQKERNVYLTGEAYFEIAKDKVHPFIVKTKNQQVTVLGTHFNINSYTDEPSTKTTLAEGKIQILSESGIKKILMPGEQALLSNNAISVTNADIEETLAWKNGYFRFNDESIQSIMRKISRWYNVEVKYISDAPNQSLNGRISRSKDLDQVLKALEATKSVHFKVEGRRITVMK